MQDRSRGIGLDLTTPNNRQSAFFMVRANLTDSCLFNEEHESSLLPASLPTQVNIGPRPNQEISARSAVIGSCEPRVPWVIRSLGL